MAEYANWSLGRIESALEEAQQEHEASVAKMKARISDLQAARDRKLAEIEAEKLVAGMTDVQKAALTQSIQASGVESKSQVGTPGA